GTAPEKRIRGDRLKELPGLSEHCAPNQRKRQRSELDESVVEAFECVRRTRFRAIVVAQLQNHQLAHRVVTVRTVARAAFRFLTRDWFWLVSRGLEELRRGVHGHPLCVQLEARNDPNVTQQRVLKLSEPI